MNRLYLMGNLLDGDFDGKTIYFNQKRHLYNLFVEFLTVMIFINHCIVFIKPDLKDVIIYHYKIHEGSG